ncbi:Metalloproteases (zincins), catalytic [Glarea lozoyensis ATCC 20868]|uniref:Leukotriene A(4) hydrolase n=2 Tax=Glarea lozoyensis TaxID=101852 RepID=S3DCA0_GLAL2|nr:Metalloproteases (zincins), catalytic [Glarea lozoyensis ATCC 20868]EHL01211.1 putative Leukotriene A-4 hydrolase like protein [Glarea lozoyensis 74030]EPE35340.1 Metalloproteases (zincins), catalytic [Glarea lozoyensis ATCC 20868]
MASASINMPRDPNTLSNYNNWRTKHTIADLDIDFKQQRLTGTVTLQLESITEKESEEIILDTSFLDIQEISVNGSKTDHWKVADRFEPYGSPLSVRVPGGAAKGTIVAVAIALATTEKCTALQWMAPSQTSNKKFPYMFSQCQAIHNRSVFPCQDTPDVKSTYDFKIRSPLPVVASGLATGATLFEHGKDDELGTLQYSFKQEIPMPSYLFALASGDIATASIGPRSLVSTGPEELSEAKWELEADTEKFIQVAEKLIYSYKWTQYNVLVLPPSFPYGGMENPVFTFATPTIISGDRENVDVIAHELSHSWSGNLVSNASWEHFWLNEGWTTYLERRIGAAVHGEPHRDFSAIIGWKALQDSVAQYGDDHEFTKLVIDLKGKDPDDAFSSIPYEKGFHFLYYLEKLVGKSAWDKFIPHYFTTWMKKSLDSYDFKATLLDFFASDKEASKALEAVDWDSWFYKPGLPPKPDFDTSIVDKCYALADKWESNDYKPQPSDVEGWSANQIVVFLEKIQLFKTPIPVSQSKAMGSAYSLTNTRNVELSSRYFGIGLTSKDESVYQPTAELLGKVGRMKFVRPLYRKLEKVDRELAVATFEKNKDFYHPICRAQVEKDLGV